MMVAMNKRDPQFDLIYKYAEQILDTKGTVLEFVPAAYTSQTCSICGHVDAANRKTQDKFLCVECGHNENADIQAGKNILHRGLKQFNQRIA